MINHYLNCCLYSKCDLKDTTVNNYGSHADISTKNVQTQGK